MQPPKTTLLGIVLRHLRTQRGLSIGQLGEVSGVAKSTISRLETGEQRTAHDDNLEHLARALDIHPEILKNLGQHPAVPPTDEMLRLVAETLPRSIREIELRREQRVVQERSATLSVCIERLILAMHGELDPRIRRKAALLLSGLVQLMVWWAESFARSAADHTSIILESTLRSEASPEVQTIFQKAIDRLRSCYCPYPDFVVQVFEDLFRSPDEIPIVQSRSTLLEAARALAQQTEAAMQCALEQIDQQDTCADVSKTCKHALEQVIQVATNLNP